MFHSHINHLVIIVINTSMAIHTIHDIIYIQIYDMELYLLYKLCNSSLTLTKVTCITMNAVHHCMNDQQELS